MTDSALAESDANIGGIRNTRVKLCQVDLGRIAVQGHVDRRLLIRTVWRQQMNQSNVCVQVRLVQTACPGLTSARSNLCPIVREQLEHRPDHSHQDYTDRFQGRWRSYRP